MKTISFFWKIRRKCAAFTPNPALNMSKDSMSINREMGILSCRIGRLPKEVFRIHNPGVGEKTAITYTLIRNQSR